MLLFSAATAQRSQPLLPAAVQSGGERAQSDGRRLLSHLQGDVSRSRRLLLQPAQRTGTRR